MCRLCSRDGIPVPNCLDIRASSPSRSSPRAARPAGPAAASGSGRVASVPASVRSARAGTPGASTGSTTPTGRPATSAASSSSRTSAVLAATNESLQSLNTLTNTTCRELDGVTALANELRALAGPIGRQIGNYDDWPAGVQRAFDKYKAAMENCGQAFVVFNAYMEENHPTEDPAVILERSNLAIGWGGAACNAATKRIDFIEIVGRYAYQDVPSVLTHIDRGLDVVKRSRNAVKLARSKIRGIYTAQGRPVPGYFLN